MSGEDSTFESMLSPERTARIDAVLDGRLVGLTVLLEDVYKEQNMGACIRTLEALGVQQVNVIEGDAPFIPNRKITQGCHKWVDIVRHQDAAGAVRALRGQGFRVLVSSPDAEHTLDELDFSTPAALCFGNELHGITDDLAELADERFRIPMYGFTRSFNLSVALSICVHTASNARRRAIDGAGDLGDEQRQTMRRRWVRLSVREADLVSRELSKRG